MEMSREAANLWKWGGGACGSGRVEEGDGAGRRRRPAFFFTPRPTTLHKGLHQGLDVNSFEGELSFPGIVGGKPARHRQGQCQWAGCFDFLFVVSMISIRKNTFPLNRVKSETCAL